MNAHEVAWSTRVAGDATRALAFMYVLGGAACLLAATMPMDPRTPTTLLAPVGCIAVGAGGLLWLSSARACQRVLHVLVALGVITVGLLVHASATLAGAVVVAFDLPFLGMYVAYFLTRGAARRHVAFAAAVFTVAWFTRDGQTPALAWGVVVTSLVVTSEVLTHVMGQLRRSAVCDDLTGLFNRNGLRTSLDREIARARRTRQPLALVVIDVDGLKQVNDILGHASGDRLLTDLADAWVNALRREDLLARVGGDEFVLVLPDTDIDAARGVVDRMHDVKGPARGTRWSAGIAMLRDGENADDLIDRADRRMYTAKRAGRQVEAGV